MKKIHRTFMLQTFVLLGIAQTTFAADGAVNFHGRIEEDGTCLIETDSANQIVVLPTVATNMFKNTGTGYNVGETPFHISLRQCDTPSIGNVRVKFTFPNVVKNVYLAPTTGDGYARNIGIVFRNDKNNSLIVNRRLLQNNDKADGTGIEDQGNIIQPVFKFKAYYYKIADPITAGNVSATANFEIQYY